MNFELHHFPSTLLPPPKNFCKTFAASSRHYACFETNCLSFLPFSLNKLAKILSSSRIWGWELLFTLSFCFTIDPYTQCPAWCPFPWCPSTWCPTNTLKNDYRDWLPDNASSSSSISSPTLLTTSDWVWVQCEFDRDEECDMPVGMVERENPFFGCTLTKVILNLYLG